MKSAQASQSQLFSEGVFRYRCGPRYQEYEEIERNRQREREREREREKGKGARKRKRERVSSH